jgi:hypothetical protein
MPHRLLQPKVAENQRSLERRRMRAQDRKGQTISGKGIGNRLPTRSGIRLQQGRK